MFDATPNALALAALLLWPLAAWALVARLGLARGLPAGLVAGYLLLPPPPAGLDLPVLPGLTKDTIPALAALALLLALRPRGLRLMPASGPARALLALMLASPTLTILANSDPVAWGGLVLPALRPQEAVSATLAQLLLVVPLLVGRALLASEDGARALLWALVLGGLAYAGPMLLEVRLSPQLNVWVYGFFQHSFEQMMRGDGFRPIVFLYHGLWAAFLVMTSTLAALALARESQGRRAVALLAAALLLAVVVVLCKSLGSILYLALFGPLMLLGTRLRLHVAALLAVLALAYPLMKGADLVPREAILSLAERASPERANSLRFRMDQEDVLLARAAERPVLGWGLWGRHQVYDPATQRPVTISDGRWIILVGTLGWVGFVAEMGLLALPLLLAWARRGQGPPAAVTALALILGVNLADLIPNATVTPLTWLVAGCLLGWAEGPRRAPAPGAAPAAAPVPGAAPAFRTVL